jgi:hypothetical protein
MKNLIKLILATIILIGCVEKNVPKKDTVNNIAVDTVIKESKNVNPISKKKYLNFKQILDFPKIKDTLSFITELKTNYGVEKFGLKKHKILNYKKVKIYGSNKDYIIIETNCDFNNVLYQLSIFTENGKFVETISGDRYEFIKIFPKENPILVNLEVTNAGNGGHQFLKIENDTLVKLNDLYTDLPNTFDSHEDNAVFEPMELKITIKDENKDGFNDIVFSGKIVLIQGRSKDGLWYDVEKKNGKNIEYSVDNPFKKAPIQFVYIYDIRTKHFKAKEDYKKKYKEYYY